MHAKIKKQVRESASPSDCTKISCIRKVGEPRIRKLSAYEIFWIYSISKRHDLINVSLIWLTNYLFLSRIPATHNIPNDHFLYPTTPHDTGIRRSVVLYCGDAKTTAQARQITSGKFLLVAWAVTNFSPLPEVFSYEKYDFRLFQCVQPTKIITYW